MNPSKSRIESLDFWPVHLPVRRAHPSRARRRAFGDEALPAIIVEIHDSSGLAGYGESPVVHSVAGSLGILESIRPMVLGQPTDNLEPLRTRLFHELKMEHFHVHIAQGLLSGIEMALWDLLGQRAGLPLCQLWGGQYRDRVECCGHVPRGNIDNVVEDARELVESGFNTLYLKVGFDDEEDMTLVQAVRKAVGSSIKIRIDANQAWDPARAIRVLLRLEDVGIEFVEQPLIKTNLSELRMLRSRTKVPVLAHESSWTVFEVLQVVVAGAADAIQIDPRFEYGVMGARKSAAVAEAAGLPVCLHTWGETGVATAFFVHMAASMSNCAIASQSYYYEILEDVLPTRLGFDRGAISVPEGPGIGVQPTRDRLGA